MSNQMGLFYLIFLCFLAEITPLVLSFFLQQVGCLISIGNSSKRASGGGAAYRRRAVITESKVSQTLS